MMRSCIVVCGAFSLPGPIYRATSTIYAVTTTPVIAPTSTATFPPVSTLPTAPAANDFAISPDGTTAYFLQGATCCTISAMSLSTGKTVHTYQAGEGAA